MELLYSTAPHYLPLYLKVRHCALLLYSYWSPSYHAATHNTPHWTQGYIVSFLLYLHSPLLAANSPQNTYTLTCFIPAVCYFVEYFGPLRKKDNYSYYTAPLLWILQIRDTVQWVEA